MKAAAEAALAGPADDHDSRKLKKADRMKHVTKNKAEGTDLFKGGNYLHAQNRYVKALVHCGKFMSDLTPEDEQEVKTLKESLHLNLAMCYLKLEEWKKAKASCDSALEFNETVKGTQHAHLFPAPHGCTLKCSVTFLSLFFGCVRVVVVFFLLFDHPFSFFGCSQ